MTAQARERARHHVAIALTDLMLAMEETPGPYPDPECPIHRWQLAHEHLTAALALLESPREK